MRIFYLLFLSFSSILSQNLVLNPSFEEYFDCPKGISFFHRNVKHWSVPNNGTTDYYNSCSDQMGFNNFIGMQKPKTGEGFAGIYVYQKGNYREYVQGKLSKNLDRDKIYEVSFYINLAENSSHAIKNFQILFSSTKLISYTGDYIDVEKLSKKTKLLKSLQFANEGFVTDTINWIKFTAQYKASGFENYFTIGNFDSNSKLEKLKVKSQKGTSQGHYYIDDVSIQSLKKEISTETIIENEIEESLFETNKIYTFKNVLFEFDKSDLLEVSKIELLKLSDYLLNNPELTIEIYGHTDTIGTQKRNDELSIERAKSVSDYLILHGLDERRIKWFGYGSSKPIEDNNYEEGRSKNRRVEFKLIEI